MDETVTTKKIISTAIISQPKWEEKHKETEIMIKNEVATKNIALNRLKLMVTITMLSVVNYYQKTS